MVVHRASCGEPRESARLLSIELCARSFWVHGRASARAEGVAKPPHPALSPKDGGEGRFRLAIGGGHAEHAEDDWRPYPAVDNTGSGIRRSVVRTHVPCVRSGVARSRQTGTSSPLRIDPSASKYTSK